MDIPIVNIVTGESHVVVREYDDTVEIFTARVGEELQLGHYKLLHNNEDLDEATFSMLMEGDELELEISDSGVAVVAIEKAGFTPTVTGLKLAIRQGKLRCVPFFLEAGIYSSECVVTAARHGKSKIISLLLDHSPDDVNEQDWGGNTPLMLAVAHSYKKTTELLLSKGANPNISNDQGLSPFDVSKRIGNKQICRLLGGSRRAKQHS